MADDSFRLDWSLTGFGFTHSTPCRLQQNLGAADGEKVWTYLCIAHVEDKFRFLGYGTRCFLLNVQITNTKKNVSALFSLTHDGKIFGIGRNYLITLTAKVVL